MRLPITPGTRLGRYEIVASLGSGGMGEVYRATDATLRRDIALKVLPPSIVEDHTRVARFEQEARATAALHHRNIVTIHDFGIAGTTPYLVTELLDGESLADVTGRGAVPVRRAISWALQMLHGIAAAHARGIIHRDLKPANIFILPDGSLKILDFGLAKVRDATPVADAPTTRLSEEGMVFGTIGYMAPEQIRGGDVDARSDIFSFAVVLYEMLAGTPPFHRATSAETITAILRDDPPRLATPVPLALATVIQIRRAHILSGGYDADTRHVPDAMRQSVIERDGGKCRSCGGAGSEIDHITGDESIPENLQLLCAECHRQKTMRNFERLSADEHPTLWAKAAMLDERALRDEPSRLCDHPDWRNLYQSIRSARRRALTEPR